MAVKQYDIGQMRQIARFEKNEPTQLGAGKKDNYQPFTTTRCWLKRKSGNRFASLGEAVLGTQWEMGCRAYAELTNDLSKSIKVLINNMIFTVESYELVGEKNHYYYFVLNEAR